MKKILIVSALAATMLAGCSAAGPNQTIGTGVGAVGGYGVARALGAGPGGAAAGAVAGALIGNSVGQNMDQQNRNQPRVIYVEERPYYQRCTMVRSYDPYYNVYRDRRVCR